ncbi:uncharacterized protein LOC107022764 isoform X1 [Solanum pennellii]|uniref:Uncharacterized protein LOC107022764 isoform X1 n=1 Tax=Solanum pennellii TaxID=28526 RepID=A0ABM1H0Y9_SOLPN|nr:uncharacterized protein LOC107022764 isoform X1 [Solanum pennellii]
MRSREEFPILLSPPLTLRPSLFFSAFCLPAKPQTTTNSSGGETANNNIISSRLLFQKSHQSSEHQQPASTIKLSVAIGCPREENIVVVQCCWKQWQVYLEWWEICYSCSKKTV